MPDQTNEGSIWEQTPNLRIDPVLDLNHRTLKAPAPTPAAYPLDSHQRAQLDHVRLESGAPPSSLRSFRNPGSDDACTMKSLAALLLFLSATITFAAAPSDEIEGLLAYIKGLDQASFIRNGTAYSPVEAEAHLRMKWNNAKAHVKTAEDFIELCASKSSMSGKAYLIRFRDGRTVGAGVELKTKLTALRTAGQGSP